MLEPVLHAQRVTKEFPGVTALKSAHLELAQGEIHALVGENGAGKSTFVKIITGLIEPTAGELFYRGAPARWNDVTSAIRAGVVAIYQEPAVFPDLDVAENIFMAHEPVHTLTQKIRWSQIYDRTGDLLDQLGAHLSPRSRVRSLSVAETQMVEIAKALSVDARVVLMDEPTSALSISESEQLFRIVRQLRDENRAIIFISHRMEDIFGLADRITVLRDGETVGMRSAEETNREEIIRLMVGRSVSQLFPKSESTPGEEVLRLEQLTLPGSFRNVSFSVNRGEIVGLYGLIGAGRTEVAQAVFGLHPAESGSIYVSGRPVDIKRPQDAIDLGIAYLPEDRDEEGIILNMDVVRNISLPILQRFLRARLIDESQEARVTSSYATQMDVRAASFMQPVMTLSGGNKQKVALSKWLATEATILLLDEPTKGIDVGAKETVHRFIDQLAREGYAILMISSELPEIMGMSDRIVVMHEGRIKASFVRSDADQNRILTSALADEDSLSPEERADG